MIDAHEASQSRTNGAQLVLSGSVMSEPEYGALTTLSQNIVQNYVQPPKKRYTTGSLLAKVLAVVALISNHPMGTISTAGKVP